MQENINCRGIWFVPNQATNGIPGFLEYIPSKGIELQLMGVFEDRCDDWHKLTFINGISEDGKKITLYQCFRFQRVFNSNSYETSSYDAMYMFVGKHFGSIDEMNFEKISFSLADFDTWVGEFGFIKIQSNDETREIFIEYKRPEDAAFQVTEAINCAIRFNAEYPLGKRRSKATITQAVEVQIWSNTRAAKFEDLLKWSQTFQRLMALAYFTLPLVSRLSVSVKETPDDAEGHISSVDVYYRPHTTKANYKNMRSNGDFLFTYSQVNSNFGSILKTWFTIENLLEPTVAGLTETFMQGEQPVEFKFLGLTQAIETFHRRTAHEAGYNNEQHNEKMKTILESVPEEYKTWLNEKLQYSHEPSFKERLKELSDGISEPIKKLLFKPTVSQFLNHIRDSRNYYTHYNEKINARALKGADLFELAERMRVFLVCLVLKEIGFTEKEVVKTILVKGTSLFNHIIKYDEAKKTFEEWAKSNGDDKSELSEIYE